MRLAPTLLVRNGTILFAISIAFAYAIYPHWLTLSHFAEHWYTLIPFAIAMLIAVLELWYLGGRLRQYLHLGAGANALRASAVCAALVVCIPYTVNKALHNIVALLFVLLAAFGFAVIAKQLRQYALGMLSAALVIICVLELVFLARYNAHPVYPWVWVALEMTAIVLLTVALYTIAVILERSATAPSDSSRTVRSS